MKNLHRSKFPAKPSASSTNAVSVDLMPKKRNGKAVLHSDSSPKADAVLFFRDVQFGPNEGELRQLLYARR
ncbi:unnamed protein product [Eruca vesicaria subsp. sativa]|uniref:Uncharacterized protein n=1 Tax=Eruca vesicaria subsp. sativa TaxID=29727 RepID=A0ABC8K129_ERUVS|nr:unnamed protein product [Eruca vesicaria subsp. sativa]